MLIEQFANRAVQLRRQVPDEHLAGLDGGPENPYAGKPVEFGVTLRRVLEVG